MKAFGNSLFIVPSFPSIPSNIPYHSYTTGKEDLKQWNGSFPTFVMEDFLHEMLLAACCGQRPYLFSAINTCVLEAFLRFQATLRYLYSWVAPNVFFLQTFDVETVLSPAQQHMWSIFLNFLVPTGNKNCFCSWICRFELMIHCSIGLLLFMNPIFEAIVLMKSRE